MDIDLQHMLFDTELTRRMLASYVPACDKQYKVQVFRNHSFEMVGHTINAFLDYAGFGVDFSYSGYDDSFSFAELNQDTDLILIWIDVTRYASDVGRQILDSCVERLRCLNDKPVLIAPFGADMQSDRSDMVVFNLSTVAQQMGPAFTDLRAQEVSGTPLSSKAMLRISRILGLRYLPALLRPAIKAIVVDLDNTLYGGVLGEEGIDGLKVTFGHLALQRALKELAVNGLFLCVASKNDEDQVLQLFRERQDLALSKDDFTFICASWDSKVDSVHKIARHLNIGTDSILFIDDNIGELAAVQATFPEIKLIHAYEDASKTCRVLEEFPGLFRLTHSRTDVLRRSDVQANESRRQMKQSMPLNEYLRSLHLQLKYVHDDLSQAQRVAELANKTNQFIFSYRRYTQAAVEKMMNSSDYVVVTVSLSDKLSDSGMIGVCVGQRTSDHTVIEECFVSCRALGRGIDHIIILEAIRQIADKFRQPMQVRFCVGERNMPAQRFVREYLAEYLKTPKLFTWQIDTAMKDICTICIDT